MTITSEPTTATSADVSDLPHGWRWVKFGDVVRQVKVDVKPEESGLERYVAGEHMGTDDLHIRRWGVIGGGYLGPAFHRKFVKGQVLYGSRRTYLRKVAVAEFDGICANTTFVLEPADDQLLPDLLPFIMQTDAFNEHSVKQSKGSVNPYVNFSDIAWYEFAIPPIDEQQRIAEILWAAEQAIQQYQLAADRSDSSQRILTSALTSGSLVTSEGIETSLGPLPARWRVAKLGDLLDVCQYGSSAPLASEGRYPVFRMMNLVDGLVVANDIKYADFTEAEFSNYRLEPGDILFNRTNSIDLVGKVGIYLMQGRHAFASYLIRLRPRRDAVTAEYLNYYLNSERAQRKIASLATPGVSQANINASNLKKLLIPVPPLDEQKKINALLAQVRTQRQAIVGHLDHVRGVKSSLLRTLLGGQIGV